MDIKQFSFPEGTPLVQKDDGTIRVIGSRITLDTIVARYQQGDTPEKIENSFPTLSLAQINAVIEWYRNHQAEADEYLAEQEAEAEVLWNRITSRPEYKVWHEELLRRAEEFRRGRAELIET